MTVEQHAPLAPSSAAGIVQCPGSVRMQANYPEQEETEASREGTAAHWVLAMTLEHGRSPQTGIVAPNGVPVTEEMREACRDICEDVTGTLAAASRGSILRIEQHVAAPRMVHKDFWGTPDVYLLDRQRQTLHVWDYKYGHRFVEVMENWQLIGYAACILETEGIGLAEACSWTFSFTIAQPRCYVRDTLGGPIREWIVQGPVVMAKISNLSAACEVASKPDAPTRTGSYCLDCRAAWDCEANQRSGGVAIEVINGQHALGMDPASIGLQLKVLQDAQDRVKALVSAYEARALALLNGGQSVPHHAIGWTQPRTVWDKERVEEAASLVAMFTDGVARIGVALPTPQQCVKAGVDETVISPYTTKASATQKLVRIDDNHAAKAFGRR